MLTSTGDIGQLVFQRRTQSALKTQMADVSDQLVSGQIKDPAAQNGANWKHAADLVADQYRSGALKAANADAERRLSAMVSTLEHVAEDSAAVALRVANLDLTTTTTDYAELRNTVEAAALSVLTRLNQSSAGIYLFSGAETATPPVQQASKFWDRVDQAVELAPDPVDAIRSFFAPGGGFDQHILSLESQGVATVQIGDRTTAGVTVRADSDPIRQVLEGLALARLSIPSDPTNGTKHDPVIAQAATQALFAAGNSLQTELATLGVLQNRVQRSSEELADAFDKTQTSLSKLTSADPFDSATRLEALQTQLETLFAVSARVGRISLLNYVR